MAAAVSLRETFHSLSHSESVRVDAGETWVAVAKMTRDRAEERMREVIRPHLAHRDDRDDLELAPRLVYTPFWRVKLAVDGLRLRSSPCVMSIANIAFPLPPPSIGGRAGIMMISARSDVPYTPRLPSFFGGTDPDALEVQRTDLVPLTSESAIDVLWEEEIVDADVDRATGESTAAKLLVDLLDGATRAMPRVESTLFVVYPFWLARFGPDDEHFVMLSALDGKLVSARFPRAPTISERVRRFFSG